MNEGLFFLHLGIATISLYPFMRMGKGGLMSWCVLQPILANLFVLKEMTLFGFSVTCSDVYAVSCALGLNLLQEYYGKEAAKKTVWCSFLLLILFVIMSLVHLLYTPSAHDAMHPAYVQILSQAPRLVIASIISFLCVQWLDVQLFGYLKEQSKLSLVSRSVICLSASQFVDTLLFTVLGLWGLVSSLVDVFIVSFIIKLTIALFLSFTTIRHARYAV